MTDAADGREPGAFATRRVDKPWGHELIWALTDRFCGKTLVIETEIGRASCRERV